MKSKELAREITVAKNYKERIGTFKLEQIAEMKDWLKAEKESISRTSEREFFFVSERKSLINITGTTSGKNNELAPLAKKSKCT